MTWEDFLNDNELNDEDTRDSTKYPGPPNGEYLLRQVSHDVRGCLNTFINYTAGIHGLSDRIPPLTLECVRKWTPTVYAWRSEVLTVRPPAEKYPPASPEWARMVAHVGELIQAAPKFKAEMESLVLPEDETAHYLVEQAVYQATKLGSLWHDIQAQQYTRLYRMRG